MHRFSIENFTQGHPGLGAGQAIQYLTRTGAFADLVEPSRDDATFQLEHMTGANFPEGHRNDLRHVEVKHLPDWAQGDPGVFFRAAQQSERGGSQRGGRFYSIMELSLPRELDRGQQLELTREFVQAILPDKVTLWVLHEPQAKDGPQPHVHIMFSARNVGDGSKGPEVFFKQPNAAHPERGGFGKDRFFNQHDAPLRLRLAWTDLTNMALERAGAARRVTADALHRQGVRPLYAYQQPGDSRHDGPQYAPRTPEEQAQQQAYAVAQWDARKQVLGIVAGAASMDLKMFGQFVKTGAGRPNARVHAAPAISVEARTRRWELPLIGNKKSMIYHAFTHKHYGDVHPKNQVRFWTEQEAQDAGYRRAVNDHYGQGSGQPMTVDQATQRLHAIAEKYAHQQSPALRGVRRPLQPVAARAHGAEAEGGGGALRVHLYPEKTETQGVEW